MSPSTNQSNPKGNPKVANPYARKKKSKTTAAGGSTETVSIPIGATTFSQAFAPVEDTPHYQAQVGGDNSVATTENSEARAQQRIFDSQAQLDEAARLEARDHHALLQPHVLYVSTKQRGNGVLKYIRNVPYQMTKMVPDYILQTQRCALFLSIKYHGLHPEYIHRRIAELKTDFKLRILLTLVDVDDNANALLFLNKLAVKHDFTLILAWSEEEAARYLETFKAFDGKDASLIQKREQHNFVDQVADFLCTVRSVNKTDASQLLSQFSSIKLLMGASEDELSLCPGLGEKKVKRLWDAFHKPFSSQQAKKRRLERESKEADAKNDESNESDAEDSEQAFQKKIAE